jgi:hypothetical protein
LSIVREKTIKARFGAALCYSPFTFVFHFCVGVGLFGDTIAAHHLKGAFCLMLDGLFVAIKT